LFGIKFYATSGKILDKSHSHPPVTLIPAMASDFMKFHASAASGLKNGQSDRKRNYAILAEFHTSFWISALTFLSPDPHPAENLIFKSR